MLNIKGVYKNFGKLEVLKGVSTEIAEGEVVSIIGASGSGKSTLLRCMNLLETPTFGEVWMEGKLLTPVDPYLHPEVITASKTFKKLVAEGISEEDAIIKIKKEDLLNEKFSAAEGKEYKLAIKKISSISTSPVRRWVWFSSSSTSLTTKRFFRILPSLP